MGTYDFNTATTSVYAFWQYELCDVFIELTKPVVSDDSPVRRELIHTSTVPIRGGLTRVFTAPPLFSSPAGAP